MRKLFYLFICHAFNYCQERNEWSILKFVYTFSMVQKIEQSNFIYKKAYETQASSIFIIDAAGIGS